jgi:opacity protein-like surface antigen
MTITNTTRILKTISLAALALALLAGASAAVAQDREGRWEFTLGTFYQLGTTLDVEAPSTAETDNDFGFSLGSGYNFSDNLAANFGLQWAGVGYDAVVFPEEGNITSISGKYDAFTLSANVVYNFTDNQLTPYVGAGIGWTWIDTNIPDGAPSTGCWWDPWWGYVCYTTYPTKTASAFSYQATLGLRYTFDSDNTFLRLGYTSQWMDFDNTTSTPRFDVIALDFGWMF